MYCWEAARGGLACDVALPAGMLVNPGVSAAYRGRALDWLANRRGWLVYGQMVIDRKAGGPAVAPPGLGDPHAPVRHLIGFGHVATLPGGSKALAVSPFDAGKLD